MPASPSSRSCEDVLCSGGREKARERRSPRRPSALMARVWRRAVIAPVLRHHGRPSLSELSELGGRRLHRDPVSFLSTLGSRQDDPPLAKALEEFHTLWEQVDERVNVASSRYPVPWGLEEEFGATLYVMTRWTRPTSVVECGVADGRSTFLFLQALRANRRGSLHSIDVSHDVGSLLNEEDRAAWHLHLLPWPPRGAQLRSLLSSLPPPDLFFHDSDHSYRWQRLEYRLARERMEPGSLLMSDDVDASRAFLELCEQWQRSPSLLMGAKAVLGAVTL